MWADENWTDEAPAEIRKMFSPEGCENFTAAADMVSVKHGEWIKTYSEYFFKCSECECTSYPKTYCPECGARMDGGN